MPNALEKLFGPQIELLKEARKALVLCLAECPRDVFVLALNGDPSGVKWFLCQSSFGLHFGSVVNALPLRKPLPDIQLGNARLPCGAIPIPEMMLFKTAIDLSIVELNDAIKELENDV